MKKAKLLVMAAVLSTAFAFTGCSSGDAADNIGRMLDGGSGVKEYDNNSVYYDGRRYGKDGTGFSVEYGTDAADGKYYTNGGVNYGNPYMGAKGNTTVSGGTEGNNAVSRYSGTAYGGGYANLGE